MAGLLVTIPFKDVALVGGTAKTVCQVIVPSDQLIRLPERAVYFDGVTAGNTPVLIELVEQHVGTGTFGTAGFIPNHLTRGFKGVIQPRCRGQLNASAEPTDDGTAAILAQLRIHPMSGQEKLDVLRNLLLGPGQAYGLRVTAPQAVNVTGGLVIEE